MSITVKTDKRYLASGEVLPQEAVPLAWDWASFGWGALAGVAGTIAVGGVILYFTWPYLAAFVTGAWIGRAASY